MSVLESFINSLDETQRHSYDAVCQTIIKSEDSLRQINAELAKMDAQINFRESLKIKLRSLYEQRASIELKALRDNADRLNVKIKNFNLPPPARGASQTSA